MLVLLFYYTTVGHKSHCLKYWNVTNNEPTNWKQESLFFKDVSYVSKRLLGNAVGFVGLRADLQMPLCIIMRQHWLSFFLHQHHWRNIDNKWKNVLFAEHRCCIMKWLCVFSEENDSLRISNMRDFTVQLHHKKLKGKFRFHATWVWFILIVFLA